MTDEDKKSYLTVPYLYKDKDVILTEQGFVYDGKVIKSVKATQEEIEEFNLSVKAKISENKMIKEVVLEEEVKEIISDRVEEPAKTEIVEEEVKEIISDQVEEPVKTEIVEEEVKEKKKK